MRRVVALGSADAFSSAARGNTCWLVEDGAPLCAVDLGPTALLALRRLGRDPEELRAVLRQIQASSGFPNSRRTENG